MPKKPNTDLWVGLGLLTAGFLIMRARQQHQPAQVDGLGFGFAKKAFKKAKKAVKKVASGARKVVKTAVDPRKHIAKIVQTVNPSKPQKAKPATPGQEVEYQDEHGNVISEAEYNRLIEMYQRREQEALQAAQRPPVVAQPAKPPAHGSPDPAPVPAPVPAPAPDTTDWGAILRSEAIGPGFSTMPVHPRMPSAASTATPATAGKINPLLTIGTLIAVPVVMGVMGDS